MTHTLAVEIKKLENFEGLPLPFYATMSSAGMDLSAAITNEISILPSQRALVPTGISIALPQGFEAQVRPRSGLAFKHGITVANAPGTIDADYRGEICVILINLGNEPFTVTRGMRIAQMVIAQFYQVNWNIVEALSKTERDSNGFGSTGTS